MLTIQNYIIVLLNKFRCKGSIRGISVVSKTGKFLAKLWNDESGVSAVEYVLLLALVGTALIVGASLLGDSVANELTDKADCIASDGNTC